VKAVKKTASAIFPCIPFDRASGVPIYRQIYEGYRGAIISGLLRPGQRLPSTRALATELKISRLPAVIAYEQLLHEGYIDGKVGVGTYVNVSIPDELAKPILVRGPANPSRPVVAPPQSSVASDPGPLGPFRVSLPALDLFPGKLWSRLVYRHAKRLPIDLMAYGDPAGYLPLREAIAQYLRAARAVRCEASQVLITAGSQMALQLCAMALLKQGDAVCVEEPGYPGARDALRIAGANLVPISVDDEGIDVGAIAALGGRVRAAYVTPSHQYPLGLSMTASRRFGLLDWAQRNRGWILEDDYDSEFRYASRPIGSLQGLDTASRVIYIGSFSKVLFPSLRVGYVVVPADLSSAFAQMREALDIFSPVLYQLALTDFIQEGHFARHLRRMRAVYLSRRNSLVECLRERVGAPLELYNADAGLHLSAFLPEAVDDREVVRMAAQRGVAATALSTCYVGRASRSGLVLGFGGANERQIARAARTLGGVLRDLV
jgi:GntR family transcriptional regulator / MocR family aminotransferase